MLPNEATTRSDIITLPGELEALVAAPGRDEARPLVAFLKQEKLNVTLVPDADSAFEEALLHRPNVVLVHEALPPAGGVELCQRLKANTRTHFLPAVLFATSDNRHQRIRALAAGADAVFAPTTDEQERRTRLWALLRSQALYRRQDRKGEEQRTVLQERGRWIGNFVHDLQNAMGALQANFEFLGQLAVNAGAIRDDDARDCLRETRALLQQLTRGLRTVQDYERFESGRVVLRRGPLHLGEMLVEVKEELTFHLNGAGRTVVIEGEPALDTTASGVVPLDGDRDQVRQALTALATYLARQPHTTEVRLRLQPEEAGARIEVASDGPPIPPDERARIFEPYVRVPRRATLAHGLGLALARAIIQLHDGTVRADEDSRSGGPIFVVQLKSRDLAPKQRSGE
jgi:signal transduction histidine kinase